MRALRPLALLALLVALGVSPVGHAHVPEAAGRDIEIEDMTISHAIYGELVSADDLYIIRMTFDEPYALPFEMLTPHKRKLEDHRPTFAVVGPGLPAPTEAELEILPQELPVGAGVYLEPDGAQERLVIFESFTRRVFWSTGPVALALMPGDFEVWVFSPQGTTGDFVLGFGVEEDFSGVGCGDLASDWSTYAY